jgi:hypothetical protein
MLIPLGVLAAAGSAPVFPSAITGLVARYDAQDLTSISLSGSDVTQWNDLSGNNRHATQGTSTFRPKSGTRTLNGKNVIDFDGTNDQLINDGVVASFTGEDKPFTVFYVIDRDSAANTAWSFTRAGSGIPYIWQYADSMDIRDDSNSTSLFIVPGSSSSGGKAVTHRSTGTSFNAYLNGTEVTSATSYNRGNITLDRSRIGVYNAGGTTAFHLDGAIGELIYYNRQLTTDEVSQVNAYLLSRWGL